MEVESSDLNSSYIFSNMIRFGGINALMYGKVADMCVMVAAAVFKSVCRFEKSWPLVVFFLWQLCNLCLLLANEEQCVKNPCVVRFC